jgi:hypothetical protein
MNPAGCRFESTISRACAQAQQVEAAFRQSEIGFPELDLAHPSSR